MKKVNYITMVMCLLLAACDGSDTEEAHPAQTVSFKAITNAWFEQAPEDIPPSPTDVMFEYDANDDPNAFTELLASHTDKSSVP